MAVEKFDIQQSYDRILLLGKKALNIFFQVAHSGRRWATFFRPKILLKSDSDQVDNKIAAKIKVALGQGAAILGGESPFSFFKSFYVRVIAAWLFLFFNQQFDCNSITSGLF